MHDERSRRGGFARLTVLTVALVSAALAAPGLGWAQTGDVAPLDPQQLRSGVSRTLVGLVLDRPRSLAAVAIASAAESDQLAGDLTALLAAGQGPNGGPPPPGLDAEAATIATAAAECANEAQQSVGYSSQDLESLKAVLGGKLDLDDSEPRPEGALQIVHWLTGMVVGQRQRNAAVDQCVQQSMLGLGRLRAYRSLYPS